ncbi:MAG: hypothetical protein C4287_03945, partial [Leptolyngbya sp. ERB_1_2]
MGREQATALVAVLVKLQVDCFLLVMSIEFQWEWVALGSHLLSESFLLADEADQKRRAAPNLLAVLKSEPDWVT